MIRIKNTRTGKTTTAKDGKDAALMARIELDRRTGLELSEAADEDKAQREQAHGELQARLSA